MVDIYLKNGKKDFLLDDIVLLYSIYSVRVLFKTERLEMEEGFPRERYRDSYFIREGRRKFMDRWNSITYGFDHYSAYLSLLNWLLLSRGTPVLIPSRPPFWTYWRSFLYLALVHVMWIYPTLNSICSLICLSDCLFKKIVWDLGEGKHDSTSCRVIKE